MYVVKTYPKYTFASHESENLGAAFKHTFKNRHFDEIHMSFIYEIPNNFMLRCNENPSSTANGKKKILPTKKNLIKIIKVSATVLKYLQGHQFEV